MSIHRLRCILNVSCLEKLCPYRIALPRLVSFKPSRHEARGSAIAAFFTTRIRKSWRPGGTRRGLRANLIFQAGTAPSSAQTTTRSFSSSTKPPLFQRVIGPALSVERTDITSSRRRGAPPIPKLRAASRPSRKLTRNYIPSAQFAAATKSHMTSSSRIFRRAPS